MRIFAWMLGLSALLLADAMLTGCESSLFADRDPSARRLTYFGDSGDRAVGSRERRQQNAQTGFGYPGGPSQQ